MGIIEGFYPRAGTIKRYFPKTEEEWLGLRLQNVSSTESSCLFNANPYQGIFEMWHRKKDKIIIDIEKNERMKWGNRLERTIARGIAEDQGWKIRKMNEYAVDEEIKMGASFDYGIGTEGILEVKNIDSLAFKFGWILNDDGSVEAPPYIEIQVQHQLAITGRKFAYIGALVGGNTVHLIKREPDSQVIKKIRKEVVKFWESIEKNEEPPFYTASDVSFASEMYSGVNEGSKLDARGDLELSNLCKRYKDMQDNIKVYDAEKDRLKVQILQRIGDHEKTIGDTFNISTSLVKESEISYTRKGYRSFRLTYKGE